MSGEAPHRQVRLVILHEILYPYRLAIGDVQADEMAHRTQRVNAVAVHGRRAARAGAVAHLVLDRVVILPEVLAGLLVETEYTLFAGNPRALGKAALGELRTVGRHEVENEHLALRDGRSGVPDPGRHTPQLLRPAPRERFDDAGLAPHPVSPRPEPLRPVVCTDVGREEGQSQNPQRGAHKYSFGKPTRSYGRAIGTTGEIPPSFGPVEPGRGLSYSNPTARPSQPPIPQSSDACSKASPA